MDGGVAPKIDTQGINDDIVVAVIEQLEKTGNRPHLVKELAAVLVNLNSTVAKYVLPSHSLLLCLTTAILTSGFPTVPRIPLRSSLRGSQPI
jgi:hypothetical protein